MEEIISKEHMEEPVIRFGDGLNLDNLFRVKGRQGLYTLRSGASKSGMVGMMEFLDMNNTKTVHKRDLECLGELRISTFNDSKIELITINEIFSNLHDQESELVKVDLDAKPIEELMEIMAPNFSSDFKQSHAKRVYAWYKYIIEKLKAATDEEDTGKDKTEDKE